MYRTYGLCFGCDLRQLYYHAPDLWASHFLSLEYEILLVSFSSLSSQIEDIMATDSINTTIPKHDAMIINILMVQMY